MNTLQIIRKIVWLVLFYLIALYSVFSLTKCAKFTAPEETQPCREPGHKIAVQSFICEDTLSLYRILLSDKGFYASSVINGVSTLYAELREAVIDEENINALTTTQEPFSIPITPTSDSSFIFNTASLDSILMVSMDFEGDIEMFCDIELFTPLSIVKIERNHEILCN